MKRSILAVALAWTSFQAAASAAATPCGVASILMWGTTGTGPGQFVQPFGISIPGDGLVYVTDQQNERVQVFNEFGVFVRQWTIPPGPSGFAHPTGICVSNGVVWVSSHQGHQVSRWSTTGTFLGLAASPPSGWSLPTDIAVTPTGNILVCDSGHNRVVNLTPGGTYFSQFATASMPYGISVHPNGRIYVGSYGGSVVQRFSSLGLNELNFGTFGSGPGQFMSAEGIAIDGVGGHLYVCDTGNDRVQRFNTSGVYQCEFGGTGTLPNKMDVPSDIAIGSEGDLFVVEYLNNRIQRFSDHGPTPARSTSWGRIKAIYR